MEALSLRELGVIIVRNWEKINYAAKPYLSAMLQLDEITDFFGADSGREVVLYFLANATTWRGPVAKEVKAELKRRLAVMHH